MKLILSTLAIALASVHALANSYSTTFSNPSSEAANWLQGKSNAVNWNNCGFSPGLVYGQQSSTSGSQTYADASCALAGTWGPNQSATGTVAFLSMSYGSAVEVELRINTTISANNITGYEGNCSIPVQSANTYCTITRWDGPLNSFTTIAQETRSAVGPNDKLTLARSGSTISLSKNGTQLLTVSDNRYMGGAPGVGFYNGNGVSSEQTFGFSAFSASDGGATPDGASAAPSVPLSWSAPNNQGVTLIMRAQVNSPTSCGVATNWSLLATVSTSSYTDTAVIPSAVYCYSAIFYQGGAYSSLSNIFAVQVTNTSGGGQILSPPQPVSSVTDLKGSVIN